MSASTSRSGRSLYGFLVFSAITAVTRCPIGPVRSHPELRSLMETAWHEAIWSRAKQVPLPATIFDDILAAINTLPPGARLSMLEDLERGRRLELPWLSGAVVRIGEEVGVDTPTHRLFAALLSPPCERASGLICEADAAGGEQAYFPALLPFPL